jgi:hypothetical protein
MINKREYRNEKETGNEESRNRGIEEKEGRGSVNGKG